MDDKRFAGLMAALKTDFQKNTPLAVAVSGGPDSMALACLLDRWANEQHDLHILTVDHGLRPESAQEAQMVAAYFPNRHRTLTWDAEKPPSRIMEQARLARYTLLVDYCRKHAIPALFVAHHLDDQAETILMRLTAGSGPDGLAGMRAQKDLDGICLLRPLLSVPKQDLVDYCLHNTIPFVHDPTNDDPDYDRPRLRRIMDSLSAEGLTPKRLATLAMRQARQRGALETWQERLWPDLLVSENPPVLHFDRMYTLPPDMRLRLLRKAAEMILPARPYAPRLDVFENLESLLFNDTRPGQSRTAGGILFTLKRREDGAKALFLTPENQNGAGHGDDSQKG